MQRPSRRDFSALLLSATALAACRRSSEPHSTRQASPRPSKRPAMPHSSSASTSSALMPTLFVGHGSPMNAVTDNQWSRGFQALGQAIPRAKAILCISAHWMTNGTAVTLNDPPRTIHDFGGFPAQLHEMEYRSPGDADLGAKIAQLLHAHQAQGRSDWGLDHGTWSVLCHSHPQADIPVLQLSLDANKTNAEHWATGLSLAPLREQGILILGSGNIVHNLRHAITQGARNPSITPGWAARFDADVAQALEQGDHQRLFSLPETSDGRLAHPSAEHYLPLLYAAAAAAGSKQAPSYPISGFDMGSISMRAVQFS